MIYSWMKSIIVYMILASLMLNLSPAGVYKKYISFFVGLIMILIVAQPLSFIFNIGSTDSFNMLVDDMDSFISSNSLSNDDSMYNYYEMSIEKGINNYINGIGYNVDKIEVITNENNQILKLTIIGLARIDESLSEDVEYVRGQLGSQFNVDIGKIVFY